jgi:hypothetical protein
MLDSRGVSTIYRRSRREVQPLRAVTFVRAAGKGVAITGPSEGRTLQYPLGLD